MIADAGEENQHSAGGRRNRGDGSVLGKLPWIAGGFWQFLRLMGGEKAAA